MAAKRLKAKGEHLSDPDMLTDILSRLPLKSLCRFRCVSKPWCNLIFDPKFTKLYNDKSRKTNPPVLLFYDRNPLEDPKPPGSDCCCPTCMSLDDEEDEDDDYYCGYPFVRKPSPPTHSLVMADFNVTVCDGIDLSNLMGFGNLTVIPSGHELVCLLIPVKKKEEVIFLSNPSTKDAVTLPKPPPTGRPGMISGRFALTFVSYAKGYKLVHLVHHQVKGKCGSFETWYQVYDIISDGENGKRFWRLGNEDSRFPYDDPWKLDVVENVDGGIYWWKKPTESLVEKRFEQIIALDLELEGEEKFLKIDKPRGIGSLPFSDLLNLVGLKGQLSLINLHGTTFGTPTMDIWILKDAMNSVWAKEHSIDLPDMSPYDFILPLHVDETEILLQKLFWETRGRGRGQILRKHTIGMKNLENERDIPVSNYKSGPYIYTQGLFALGRSKI